MNASSWIVTLVQTKNDDDVAEGTLVTMKGESKQHSPDAGEEKNERQMSFKAEKKPMKQNHHLKQNHT